MDDTILIYSLEMYVLRGGQYFVTESRGNPRIDLLELTEIEG